MEKVGGRTGRVALHCRKGQRQVFCNLRSADERFVLIAGWQIHKLSAPKKKNIKHLKLLNKTLLTDKLKNGIKIFDSELYKALKVFNNGDKEEE